MNISYLTREQRDFFVDMDPLQMMDWLEFPNTFALIATDRMEPAGEDVPMGLMICSVFKQFLIIDWLCVNADHRMQGVGEQLLLKAFEMAKNAGYGSIKAYINEEYGRELVCDRQKQYFKERLFEQEQKLFGEWLTDLRTLLLHPFFHRIGTASTRAVPFRRQSVTMIREGIAALANMRESAMLYDVNYMGDCYDPDLSCFLMDGEHVCAGLIVQCVGHDDLHGSTATLYPTLFCAGSEQEVRTLLFTAMQAACEKYDLRTDVRIVLTSGRYERLCKYILPSAHIGNKLLIANVSDL